MPEPTDTDAILERLADMLVRRFAGSDNDREFTTSNVARALGEAGLRDLLLSADEAERCLRFAFQDGALDKEIVITLYPDPFGMLRDFQAALSALAAPTAGDATDDR